MSTFTIQSPCPVCGHMFPVLIDRTTYATDATAIAEHVDIEHGGDVTAAVEA